MAKELYAVEHYVNGCWLVSGWHHSHAKANVAVELLVLIGYCRGNLRVRAEVKYIGV